MHVCCPKFSAFCPFLMSKYRKVCRISICRDINLIVRLLTTRSTYNSIVLTDLSEQQVELGDNPRLVERQSHHVAPLLPANGGKDAWVLPAACLTVEALVWSQ